MRWSEFEDDAGPAVAALAREGVTRNGVVLVGTVRKDGTPRITPVEPWLGPDDGELWLPMMLGSAKAADLRRDRRILVHSIVTSRDGAEGDVKVRGTAHEADDTTHRRVADEIHPVLGWRPDPATSHLFRVDVEHVAHLRFDERGDLTTHLWPAKRATRRRATSDTSLGDAEDLPWP